jgi:hypothetical protein
VLSNGRLSVLPVGVGADHGIEDRQQFPHAGREGHLRRLPSRPQAEVEGRSTGLQRAAAKALMYSTVRSEARPPQPARVRQPAGRAG